MFVSGCEIEYYNSIDEKIIEESFLQSVDFIINSMKCENGICFWDCKKNSNNHEFNDSSIYSTYIAIWALSKMDLITGKLKDSVVKWVKNNQRDDFLWYDDSGQKVVDSTTRALIILILAGYIKDFEQVELYVTWLLSKQDKEGSWLYITTDKAQYKDLGVTLGVTSLFHMILNKLHFNNVDKKNEIVNSLKKAALWAHEIFQTQNRDINSINVRNTAWILRLYYNCMPKDYSKKDELYGDIKVGLQRIESWLNDNNNLKDQNVQVIYNCLWSYAIHKKDKIDTTNPCLSKGIRFMLNYVRKDKSIIENIPQNKRHIGAFILSLSEIIEKTNELKITSYSIKEKVQIYKTNLDITFLSTQIAYDQSKELESNNKELKENNEELKGKYEELKNSNQELKKNNVELKNKYKKLEEISHNIVVLSETFKLISSVNFIYFCFFMSILFSISIYYFIMYKKDIGLLVTILSTIITVISIIRGFPPREIT